MRSLTPTLLAVTLFMLLFSASGFLVGLLVARLWRRPREDVATMTFQCGMRNISAGVVIAAEYFPGGAVFPVVISILFQQVLASLFDRLLERFVYVRIR